MTKLAQLDMEGTPPNREKIPACMTTYEKKIPDVRVPWYEFVINDMLKDLQPPARRSVQWQKGALPLNLIDLLPGPVILLSLILLGIALLLG